MCECNLIDAVPVTSIRLMIRCVFAEIRAYPVALIGVGEGSDNRQYPSEFIDERPDKERAKTS